MFIVPGKASILAREPDERCHGAVIIDGTFHIFYYRRHLMKGCMRVNVANQSRNPICGHG